MAGETKVEFDVLAHDKASDKLDKIARKFRKVGDEANSVGKNTSGIDGLAKKFEKAGDDSGRGFGSRLKKWFTGRGMADVGAQGGTVFGSGFLGVLKTPILGPAVVAALAGLFATVMPAVGAVAGGALVAGFGAGLAGLGIVFAAKSEAVKSVWSKTMGQLGSDMQLLSRPFESTLINIAGHFQRTVDKFNPALAKSFAKLAPMVDEFVDGAARSLEQLIPAIGPITDAFGEVLVSLGPALHSAVGNLADGMTRLSASIQKNPDGLADMVTGLGALVGGTLQLITILNNVNGSFDKLAGGMSLVDVTISLLTFPIAALSGMFAVLGKGIDLANAALGRTGKDVADAGQSMGDAANKTALLAQGFTKTGTAAQHGAGPVKTLAERVDAAKKAAAEAKQKFEDFITTLFRLQNMALSLSGAQIGLQAAIDDATQSVKDNGRTLDINTAKGRANKTALINIATAANQQTEAMIRSGKGTASAAVAADKSRANFVAMAQKMGSSKTAALALARQMIAIPNVTRIAKLEANKRDLDAKLKAAKAQLADKSLTATKRAQLQANIKQLLAAKNQAQAAINSLRGKTVTLTTIRSTIIKQTKTSGGHAPETFAHGGPVKANVPIIVGDGGRPELFVPNSDGTIVPRVPSALSGGMAGGGTVININVNGAMDPVAVAKQIQQMLLKLKRGNRGDLGLA